MSLFNKKASCAAVTLMKTNSAVAEAYNQKSLESVKSTTSEHLLSRSVMNVLQATKALMVKRVHEQEEYQASVLIKSLLRKTGAPRGQA